MEQRNTPPKATSSPKRRTRSEILKAVDRAELMAWWRDWRFEGEVVGYELVEEESEEALWCRRGLVE
jgi:hypothetical protein